MNPASTRYEAQPDGSLKVVHSRSWGERALRLFVRCENMVLRQIAQGEVMPALFGLAWVRYDAPYAVFMPVPFNLVARGLRGAWLWLKRGGADVGYNAAEAYERGRADERRLWLLYVEPNDRG